MSTQHLLMCALLMVGCADELGMTRSASTSPDDETRLACPSGPHEITGRGRWNWGNVEAPLGPYDDIDTAKRDAETKCKERIAEAVRLTDEAAIRECKEDIARFVCGPGPEEKVCDPVSSSIKDCEVIERGGGTPDLGAPFKGIDDRYWVNCRYTATARARGKTSLSCVLRQ